MKILQINAVGQSSSTGRTCKEFADYINKYSKHSCYTAFAQGTVDEYGYQIGNRFSWKTHGLLSRITGCQAHFSARDTKKIIRYMQNMEINIVIFRNVHGNYLHFPLIMKYINRNQIPTILVLDDCWYFTGKCCHYTTDQCYKWISGCHHCSRIKKDNKSWFIDATKYLWKEKKELYENNKSLAVVGVSKWIANEAKKSILSSARRIETIYNWIDFKKFYPKNIDIANKKEVAEFIILGVASGWNEAKGIQRFIQLANMLEKDEKIILIGKMPNTIKLPDNIISIGKTESIKELVKYYNMADVFVNMSLEETFGKVAAEALACGTPIVCFNTTANPELCGNGCGFTCDKEDLAQVRVALTTIKEKGKEFYSRKCVEFAHENFDKETNIHRWLKLMDELIEETKGKEL